jgi:hypothetical protein
VHSIRLILEAQVAHPSTVAPIRADRHVQAGLHGGLGYADQEARIEVRLTEATGQPCIFGVGLARFVRKTRRERLIPEAAACDRVRDLQCLRREQSRAVTWRATPATKRAR